MTYMVIVVVLLQLCKADAKALADKMSDTEARDNRQEIIGRLETLKNEKLNLAAVSRLEEYFFYDHP